MDHSIQKEENAGASAQVNQPQPVQVGVGYALLGNLINFTDPALNTALAEALFNTQTEARIFNNLVEDAIISANEYKDTDNDIAREDAVMIISHLGTINYQE